MVESRRKLVGLLAGAVVFTGVLFAPVPAGMTPGAWKVAAVTALMVVWWISEAVPVYVTALLPLALFPLLGLSDITATAAPYAHPLVFLFMGGFLMALAMQRWGLHRRVAMTVITFMGTDRRRLVGGFMAAAALLSMWISNTATAVMLLPVAVSVAEVMSGSARRARDGFDTALLLGLAYGASIGGVATLVGTPPNALLAAFLSQNYGFEIGFARWMIVGAPVSAVMLVLSYWLLTRWAWPVAPGGATAGRSVLAELRGRLGPVGRGEWLAGAVFAAAALAWMTRPLLGSLLPGAHVSDAGIAMAAGIALFMLPGNRGSGARLLDWESAKQLPWGVLLLFGGGLSLAAAIGSSGLADWLGGRLGGLSAWPVWVALGVVVVVVVFATEITSNTATTASLLPVLAASAVGMGWNPGTLAVPAAIAASCAFMMPVATPPNAVVIGSGRVAVGDMARAGIWVNLLACAVVTGAGYLLVPVLLGVA